MNPDAGYLAHLVVGLVLGLAGAVFTFHLWKRSRASNIPHTSGPQPQEVQEALGESLTGFLCMMHTVNDAVVPIDSLGNILSWNSGVEAIFGYRKEEVIGKPLAMLIPEEYGKAYQKAWDRLHTVGHSQIIERTIELCGRRKDGGVFPMEVLLTVWRVEKRTFYGCVLRDISSRREGEEKIVDLARFPSEDPNPVLRIRQDGVLLYANPASAFLLRAWKGRVGRSTPRRWRQWVNRVYRAGQRQDVEMELDGRCFSFVMAPVNGTDYVNVYGQDLTERKRVERALQGANTRLEEAVVKLERAEDRVRQERLHALGQMACGVAHDFNNALSPILGYSDLLISMPGMLDDKEKLKEMLQIIHTAARDASIVVSRLREFYRNREANEPFVPIEINRLLEQVISLTQPRWKNQSQATGKTISIQTDFQMVPLIHGNESELREALTNLIFNAVDAMPEGGTITIRTRIENAQIAIEVQDTGIGMTEDVRQRCLEPFFSTKGDRGTGLGLAMVFGITKRHQGTLDIQSQPGHGTTISIRLPIPEHFQASESTQPHGEMPTPPLRVLIVDDEPMIQEVLREYLTGDGHQVESASNGGEALERLRAVHFDLVITDRVMPGMNGDQLALEIKRISPQIPVFLLTGFCDTMVAEGKRPEGVDQILNKPISLQSLRAALAAA